MKRLSVFSLLLIASSIILLVTALPLQVSSVQPTVFFDTFNSGPLDPAKWTQLGNGSLTFQSGYVAIRNSSIPSGIRSIPKFAVATVDFNASYTGIVKFGLVSGQNSLLFLGNGSSLRVDSNTTLNHDSFSIFVPFPGFKRFEITWTLDYVNYSINGILLRHETNAIPLVNMNLVLNATAGQLNVDSVSVGSLVADATTTLTGTTTTSTTLIITTRSNTTLVSVTRTTLTNVSSTLTSTTGTMTSGISTTTVTSTTTTPISTTTVSDTSVSTSFTSTTTVSAVSTSQTTSVTTSTLSGISTTQTVTTKTVTSGTAIAQSTIHANQTETATTTSICCIITMTGTYTTEEANIVVLATPVPIWLTIIVFGSITITGAWWALKDYVRTKVVGSRFSIPGFRSRFTRLRGKKPDDSGKGGAKDSESKSAQATVGADAGGKSEKTDTTSQVEEASAKPRPLRADFPDMLTMIRESLHRVNEDLERLSRNGSKKIGEEPN